MYPSITFPNIYPQEMKFYPQKNLNVALFILTQISKQMSSVYEQIKICNYPQKGFLLFVMVILNCQFDNLEPAGKSFSEGLSTVG